MAAVILECLVTTVSPGGQVNIAPMGIIPEGDTVVLRPFQNTTTFRNLVAVPYAVANITDDAAAFAYSALGDYRAEVLPAQAVPGYYLVSACAYWELAVLAVDASQERAAVPCRVVRRQELRPFLGYNRARNAILEATILATRVHLLPVDQVLQEIDRLAVIVAKCGDEPEVAAMSFIQDYVRRVASCPCTQA